MGDNPFGIQRFYKVMSMNVAVPPKLKLYTFKAYLNETKSDERGVYAVGYDQHIGEMGGNRKFKEKNR